MSASKIESRSHHKILIYIIKFLLFGGYEPVATWHGFCELIASLNRVYAEVLHQ
jgi:hypothetical protein